MDCGQRGPGGNTTDRREGMASFALSNGGEDAAQEESTHTEDDINSGTAEQSVLSAVLSRRLYVSHFLFTWNSRSFEFGATLFLAAAFPGTLLMLSIYAMIRSASAIIFALVLGRMIDTLDRLKIVRISIGNSLC